MNLRRRRIARLAAATALLAVMIGTISPRSQSIALGPVIAVTPNEVNAGPCCTENPSLSSRGEVVGVTDLETVDTSFVFLDTPGKEPLVDSEGITVSGNSCVALTARSTGGVIGLVAVQQLPTTFVVTDRCRGVEFPVYFTDFYNAGSNMALSFTGRFAAIQIDDSSCECSRVIRIDTATSTPQQPVVADMPVPGGYLGSYAFLGIDISDNGNVVVTPAWGLDAAGALQTNVFAWDVPSGSVQLLSRDDNPSAAYPSVSGDGRYVAFTASKRFTGAEAGSGPWVYITDRASGSIRLVSPPGASAHHTSLSRDASQVAYNVDDQPCNFLVEGCTGIRIDVAYGPGPLTTAPISTETISTATDGSVAGGGHREPVLSGNGRWVAWVSNAGNQLVNPPVGDNYNTFARRRDPGLVVDALDFGTIGASTTATVATTIRNTGRTSVSLDSITASPGQFTIQGGGTCAGGSSLPPGATCTVNVRYAAPPSTSTTTGTITVAESGYDPISAAGRLTGSSSFNPPPVTTTTLAPTTTAVGQVPPGRTTTTTSSTAPPGHVSLTADPNPVDFGQVAVGLGSPIQTVTITNIGDGSGQMLTELGGANPDDFFVVNNGCNELVIAPGQACTMQIMMIPLAGGLREASLVLTAGGVSGDIAMFGDGHFAPILLATPAAITTDGATMVIGQGFPPNQAFDVHVDPTSLVVTVTSDAQGQFQFPLSAVANLTLGSYVLRVDAVPAVFDLVQGQFVVVLGTFEPQGPGSAAFGDSIIVTRG